MLRKAAVKSAWDLYHDPNETGDVQFMRFDVDFAVQDPNKPYSDVADFFTHQLRNKEWAEQIFLKGLAVELGRDIKIFDTRMITRKHGKGVYFISGKRGAKAHNDLIGGEPLTMAYDSTYNNEHFQSILVKEPATKSFFLLP